MPVVAQKIGILGAGNMAGALIRGMLASGEVAAKDLAATDTRPERLEKLVADHGIRSFGADNDALVRWADVVFLAVKPQAVDRALEQCHGALGSRTLLVSIATGVPIRFLESRMPAGVRVVRSMPNTPAIVAAGATAIAAGTHATDADLRLAKSLFDGIGRTTVLEESLLDAVTGLSGSGPAYVMVMIEALADGGVKVGLHRDTALLLAAQTVYGSAKLLLETGEHPGRLKDMVTSPGGTAIAGLHTLEAGGLRRTLIDAVESATRRSEELGRGMTERG